MTYIETDSQKRQWKTPKDKIEQLADLMNEQSVHPLQTSDELFHIFDAALETEEIDFLLAMGGGTHSRQKLYEKTGLDQEEFDRILESLLYKGPVAVIRDADEIKSYHIMTIYPGWFEFYMMRGIDDAEHREFARRIEKMYTAAYEFGNEEVINELVKDVGPHLSVSPTSEPITISLNETLTPENHVYAASSITKLFSGLDDDEFISVGHCLCRFEKELIGDSCRVNMPMETCMSIGPAAEHLIEQGISRQISKSEAISMVKKFQDMGCVHQTGRTIPLKNFKSKYPMDVICNCCWDCCGVIGNYNRGYLPLTVTAQYRAEIVTENCTACGRCAENCPVGIITVDDVASIQDELCIGCGQCLHHCQDEAVLLKEDRRVVFLPMLGREHARIEPPAELLARMQDDETTDETTEQPDREGALKVMEETRQKYLRPELQKVFRKWNKTMLYDFTDLEESWHFEIVKGIPGPLKMGSIEKPDIHYTLTTHVFIGLTKGTIDGFKAFRKKLVKVKAPVLDLIKLQKLVG
ncbi:MAG: 4Fe-4S binding protein [Bacteroidales bacterium]|jgi:ferredoxin|nr:4Fe-4S binding protein [Bacteroidales bacterium]